MRRSKKAEWRTRFDRVSYQRVEECGQAQPEIGALAVRLSFDSFGRMSTGSPKVQKRSLQREALRHSICRDGAQGFRGMEMIVLPGRLGPVSAAARFMAGGIVLSADAAQAWSKDVMSSLEQIETGNFAAPSWLIFPPDSIRVVSWNINRGMHLQRVTEFLAKLKADIVLLQEADQNARRTHYINVAKEVAQKLKMNYVFAREFQELTQGSRTSPAYHGQATLSRWPLSNCRIIRFQQQTNFWRPHWFLPEIPPFQERLGGRLALVNEASIGSKTVVAYNLHLESRGDDRLRCAQLEEVLADAKRYGKSMPAIVGGDFNLDASSGNAADALARAEFEDALAKHRAPTKPDSFFEPGRTIDWIFVRGPARPSGAQVCRSVSASDHYPLSVDLALA
jgi:endonuclease/exonuclease/phosphatase family metal-dependent hydrolase